MKNMLRYPIYLTLLLCMIALLIIPFDGMAEGPDEDRSSENALFQQKCSLCHSIERPTSKRKSENGWRETVMRMKNVNGCPLSEEEAERIIRYLSDTRGK